MTAFTALLRKEILELYGASGQPRTSFIVNSVLSILVGLGAPIFAVFMFDLATWPTLIFAGAIVIGISGFMALMAPAAGAPDSFAGERERHTLETLLATPVRPATLLFAKAIAIMLGVWASVVMAGAAFTLSATFALGWEGLLAGLVITIFLPLAVTLWTPLLLGAGMMISAKAATTKHATQVLSYFLIPLIIVPITMGQMLARGATPSPGSLAVGGILPALVLWGATFAFWAIAWRRCSRPYLMQNR